MEKAIEADSGRLLGAPNRVFIAAAIAEWERATFTNKELLAKLKDSGHPVSGPVLSRNLGSFVAAGVLESDESGRFRRVRSAYWDLCAALLSELRERYTVPKLKATSEGGDAG